MKVEVEKIFENARIGNFDAILELKKFVQEGHDLLESFYYDGNKKMRSARLFYVTE